MTIRFKHRLTGMATTALLTLTACGGGGSAAPAAPAAVAADASDKYVGTWAGSCAAGAVSPNGDAFYKPTTIIKKAAAASYSFDAAIRSYPNNACSGAGTLVPGDAVLLVYTIVGSKTVAGVEVDKVTTPGAGATTLKDIAYVNSAGPTLQKGKGPLDADGFFTELDPSRLAKQ